MTPGIHQNKAETEIEILFCFVKKKKEVTDYEKRKI